MKQSTARLVAFVALALSACEAPAGPVAPGREAVALRSHAERLDGTGLVLDNLTGVSLPIVGQIGNIIVDQAVITDLMLVEDIAGTIIGLEATGTLTGTLSATGAPIVDERFTSTVGITSSGPGQCTLVTIDLGRLTIDALEIVTADVPTASFVGRGSGAVGSLLCNLGNLLSGTIGGLTEGVRGLVNAINSLI